MRAGNNSTTAPRRARPTARGPQQGGGGCHLRQHGQRGQRGQHNLSGACLGISAMGREARCGHVARSRSGLLATGRSSPLHAGNLEAGGPIPTHARPMTQCSPPVQTRAIVCNRLQLLCPRLSATARAALGGIGAESRAAVSSVQQQQQQEQQEQQEQQQQQRAPWDSEEGSDGDGWVFSTATSARTPSCRERGAESANLSSSSTYSS
ncbi:unnamed protein product [Lampetra planeri]